MVKTRHSRDQGEFQQYEETSRTRSTAKNDPRVEHRANGFQSDSSVEEQFGTRKQRRSYHEESDNSSQCVRRRSRRSRCTDSTSMPSSLRYYEREHINLRARSRDGHGIRRSTRQKKLTYKTYNQNLIDKQLSLIEPDSEDDSPERIKVPIRGQNQDYDGQEDDDLDEEEDALEEQEVEISETDVRRKTRCRAALDATPDDRNEKEKLAADENKGKVNREEGARNLRRGRKQAEECLIKGEETEENEQPRRSHRRLEVEPMPEAEALDMYTRVKRERPRVKRDMYGIPIHDDDKDQKSLTSESETPDQQSNEESDSTNILKRDRTMKNKSYNLRLHCRKTNLYSAPPIEPQRSYTRSIRSFCSIGASNNNYRASVRRKRTAFHSSTSSSSASDDEEHFERRKSKSMAKARQRCLPMNFAAEDIGAGVVRDRVHSGASLADVEPMAIDKSVLFDSIGGLEKHIQSLKEMIVFPLLYPEVFTKFKITPPRGVLFHGPPGTGKTLVARALANECSQGETKVAFFMRKGADCLSKWVGESERQLRLLFDQAYQMRPAIIFFDEIDGLAPVRSSRQDQIHSSIVSTLLALLDGLDDRGEIVIIGATNRIDSIDPALRRPGRFDREFLFSLPSLEARKQILQIHTKEWNPILNTGIIDDLAQRTVGYCGADLKALCTEAAIHALRRRYPQIYQSRDKLLIDVSTINIHLSDFFYAIDHIKPTAQRSSTSPAKALGEVVRPLLQATFAQAVSLLQSTFPVALCVGTQSQLNNIEDDYSDDEVSHDSLNEGRSVHQWSSTRQLPQIFRPRLLLAGDPSSGQSSHVGPAVLHHLENLAINVLDLPALFAISTRTPEESCAQIIREARRGSPSVLYLPHINELWEVVGEAVRATFMTLLRDLDPSVPILLLATCEVQYEFLPFQVRELFSELNNEVITVTEPDDKKRKEFFENLLLKQALQPPVSRKKLERKFEVLPKAPKPEARKLTATEQQRLFEQEERTLRELRLFLRDVINKLSRDRKFAVFAKPVDVDEVPDYYEIIKRPMDLSHMMTKIDHHEYEAVNQFLQDIDLICSNALEYNPDKDPQGRAIRHRACALKDVTNSIIAAELDPDFEKLCSDIAKARTDRGYFRNSKLVPTCCLSKPFEVSSANANAGICQPQGSKELNSVAETDKSGNQEMLEVAQESDDNYPRRVIKRIRFSRNQKTSSNFKSPWCRTRKRIYKKVVVYVDQDGKEIPESEGKNSSVYSSKSSQKLNHDETSEQLEPKAIKQLKSDNSSVQSTRIESKRKSPAHTPEDNKKPTNLMSFVPCDMSLSVDRVSPGVELNLMLQPTTVRTSPDKVVSPSSPIVHEHQTRKAVQTLAKALKKVIVDMPHLKVLLNELVQKTSGFCLEPLERLHSQLSLCVYRHRAENNKTQLLKELENIIGSISPLMVQKNPQTIRTQDLSI